MKKKVESREWVLRFNIKNRDNLLQIIRGQKRIETRAATEKYRVIAKGDSLLFVCGKEKLKKRIKKVEHYSSLDAMFKKINFKRIMPDMSSRAECKKMYWSYPDYKEKLKKFGVVAFYIE